VAETVAWGEVLRIDPELNRKTVQLRRCWVSDGPKNNLQITQMIYGWPTLSEGREPKNRS